jgi:chaperone BCS1
MPARPRLLYGPPGTGKSSLIAAMANYLKFDIYDLELTEVKSNSDLRRLLVGMSNRSILVVEDIDCTIDLQQRDEGEIKRAKPTNDAATLGIFVLTGDTIWTAQLCRRSVVNQRRGEDHRLHNKLQRAA